MSEDQLVNAERDFQRRLGALQEARAELLALEAALRRLSLDRPHLERGEAAALGADLNAKVARAREVVAQRHAEAKAARTVLRALTDTDAEPDELVDDAPIEGFEQPHFTDQG